MFLELHARSARWQRASRATASVARVSEPPLLYRVGGSRTCSRSTRTVGTSHGHCSQMLWAHVRRVSLRAKERWVRGRRARVAFMPVAAVGALVALSMGALPARVALRSAARFPHASPRRLAHHLADLSDHPRLYPHMYAHVYRVIFNAF